MEKKRKREPWLFLLPVLVVLLLLFGYPLINSIVMAFQNYKLTAPNDIYFNGFENFKKLFGDPDGLMILKNSIIYVVISVAGQFLLGLTLALALKKQFKGRGLYQSIVFLPWDFSGFVVGLIFRWSFNGEYGVVNNLLMKLGIIDNNIAWLGTPGYSLAVVIIAMIWMGIPFFAIMILAALQSIPADVYEAADVDGAGKFDCFRYITIPQLKATVTMTVLTRLVDLLRIFELPKVLLGGTTPFLATMSYEEYSYGNNAYSAVASTVLLALILVIVMAYMFAFEREKKGGGRR